MEKYDETKGWGEQWTARKSGLRNWEAIANQHLRNGRCMKEWRNSVYKRDNYTCQKCGIAGKVLNAHHIKPLEKFPELAFEIDNGMTMCEDCHREIDDIHMTLIR